MWVHTRDVVRDAASRPVASSAAVLSGLSLEDAHHRPQDRGNSIAWLVWHAARQMDVQTVELSGDDTVWFCGGWASRLGVDRDEGDFGLGDSGEDVAALRISDLPALQEYLAACVDALVAYADTLSGSDLGVVIDDSYDPPVTQAVRLVSIIDDAAVHIGQAGYVRGLLDGWTIGV
ncbi:MAG: DUF664 domain-containing protein [Mobilicoccus sp.]|nr:DUF664 domain-containing protein [Mobilicoccus sp.]